MYNPNKGSIMGTVYKSLTEALAKTYKREEQKLSDFVAEMRALTDKDRADFRSWFEAQGDSFTA